jgi:aminoglycoside 6'-N-acetyltransferase I
MKIIDLKPDDGHLIDRIALLLVDGFREHWPDAWPDTESARNEVKQSFEENRISRVALDDAGRVLGWIGGIEHYDGNVWELHPLVVSGDARRKGVGRALVRDLEEEVRRRGGLTLWLGTDDESGQTTLSGVNLYPDVCEHISKIKNLRDHPFEFYQKLGFVIIGVMPDANGRGKPDIYMAKQIV